MNTPGSTSWILPRTILVFSVLALSQAGNLIRLCETNAMTITFYRLFLAFLMILPFAVPTLLKTLPRVSRKVLLTVFFMSLAFSAHFFVWITAVQKAKVANAAICFSLSPIFTALGAKFFLKEAVGKKVIFAIVTGLIGILIVSQDDFSLSPEYLLGDLYAVLSGALFSVHCLLGKTLRRDAPNLFIMPVVYFFGLLMALGMVGAMGLPLVGFTLKTKIGFLALAVFPTILGHASLIYLMRFFKTATVSTALLFEPVLAGLVAFFAYQETLTVSSFLGYLFITAGLVPLFYEQPPARVAESVS